MGRCRRADDVQKESAQLLLPGPGRRCGFFPDFNLHRMYVLSSVMSVVVCQCPVATASLVSCFDFLGSILESDSRDCLSLFARRKVVGLRVCGCEWPIAEGANWTGKDAEQEGRMSKWREGAKEKNILKIKMMRRSNDEIKVNAGWKTRWSIQSKFRVSSSRN